MRRQSKYRDLFKKNCLEKIKEVFKSGLIHINQIILGEMREMDH